MKIPHRCYLLILAVLFGIWWVAPAIHPWHRNDWLLFSRASYTMIFVFMCLHQVGAHYTYSEVPYDL